MKKGPKIDELKQIWEYHKGRSDEARNKSNCTGEELRALQAQLARNAENDDFSDLQRSEANQKLKRLKKSLDAELEELHGLLVITQKAEIEYMQNLRRLKEARTVLDTIANPPCWGLGDIAPADLYAIKNRAEQTVRELS